MAALRIAIACVVTTVWAIVYVAPYFVDDSPDASPAVSGVMLCVVVYFFGTGAANAWRRVQRAAEAYNEDPDKPREVPPDAPQ